MEYINMDKRFKISKILIRNLIFLLLFALLIDGSASFGYDSSSSCSPNTKQSRRGRAQMLAAIPCDLINQAYCNLPGAAYPWHAVRRFVHENQGLMKRMYGDVRHISVLRDEILNNEIDVDDIDAAADRYSRDGYNRRASKFMHNREEFDNFKVNDVLREPHFRPVTTTSTTTTTTTTKPPSPTTTTSSTKIVVTTEGVESTVVAANDVETTTTTTTTMAAANATTNDGKTTEESTDSSTNLATDIDTDEVTTKSSSLLLEKQTREEDDVTTSAHEELVDIINIELNSVFETTSDTSAPSEMPGDNIEIVESPQLGMGNMTTESPTTSTTQQKPETTVSATTTPTQRPSTVTTTTTDAIVKTETVAERSPAKQQRKPFVPSATKHHQRPQQLHKVESTISAKLKLKMNPTQATPPRTTTSTLSSAYNATSNAALSSSTITTPLTSMKTSPFKGHLNKNYNRYTTSHNNNNKHSPPTASSPPGPSVTPSAQTLRPNSELLLGEKMRKPAASATPAVAATNKPLIRDGQLFQDTMKQEPAPVINARGVNACPVKEEVVAPFWANNTRGEILALLNLYPFEQYVHWEKCTHEHKQMYCREGCRCEQQYRLHRLLAYDPHNECRGIFSDWFRFPSCCICKCYNIPLDFRATSRSPRSEGGGHDTSDYRHPIEVAEEQVKNAIYEHATEDWYRPKDEFDFFEG